MSTTESEPVIDESLTSRQLIMLGEEAMKKMAKSSVLISGFGGLGVETGKIASFLITLPPQQKILP